MCVYVYMCMIRARLRIHDFRIVAIHYKIVQRAMAMDVNANDKFPQHGFRITRIAS